MARSEVEIEAPPPIPPEAKARATALAAKFRDRKGVAVCDVDALRELRTLRERFGSAPPLRDTLRSAFEACDERVAIAELIAETSPPEPSTEQRLVLAAAWIRAARYDDAVEVLAPASAELEPDTQAAWLLGFALFHAGKPREALPWLEGARARAGGERGVDGFVLIGLCKLDAGDPEGAIAVLEAGLATAPESHSLLTALTRAYASAGRVDDAAALSERTLSAYAATDAEELRLERLSSLTIGLNQAWEAGRYADVEQIIDKMWPDAPAATRQRLLGARAALYDKTDRPEQAAAARAALAELRGEGAPL